MNFLKKLGQIVAQGLALFTGFAPILTKVIPQTGQEVQVISKDFSAVADVVANVEAIGNLSGLTGAQKAAAAGPLVAQIVLSSSVFTNLKIKDTAAFNKACVTIAGGVADLLNSVDGDSTEKVAPNVKH